MSGFGRKNYMQKNQDWNVSEIGSVEDDGTNSYNGYENCWNENIRSSERFISN